jgi:tetratricopeptide repeat protein
MKEGALRIAAIGWFGLVLACAAAAAPGDAVASPAGGAAANQRGMALLRQKKWQAAEAEFKKAIAEDPTSVNAHYNLACAASRAHDADTAIWELAWVGDRAAWVDQAKAAAKKAASDDDLAWAIGNDINAQLFVGDAPVAAVTEITAPPRTQNAGHALGEPQRGKIAGILAAAAGPHDDKCDAADAKQGKVFALGLDLGKWAKGIAVGSLKDGVAVLDPKGAIVARSEPLGCTGPGESQDQLAALAYADGLPVPPTTSHAMHEADLQLLAVMYTTGGRREWQTNVAVFAQNGSSLIKVFEALVASNDATGSGHVWQTVLGHLLYSAPGETRKHAFQWDPRAFKFVPLP